MKQLRLIIIREYLTKVRNKSFLLMTFLSPLAVLALSLLIGYLTQLNNSTQPHIAVLSRSRAWTTERETRALLTPRKL